MSWERTIGMSFVLAPSCKARMKLDTRRTILTSRSNSKSRLACGWLAAVLAVCWVGLGGSLHAQTRARLSYNTDSDAGNLGLRGTNGERIARIFVGDNDAVGQLTIFDEGNARLILDADGASQGRIILYDSDGTDAARLTVDDVNDTGMLWLYSANSEIRARLLVDAVGQGRLDLDGDDNVERARLSINDGDNSAFLTLKGPAANKIVKAERVSASAADNGAVRVYAGGSERAKLEADASSDAGRLVLFDSSGVPTITLDGDTGMITKSGANGFLVPHPEDPEREIFYLSLEGPEAGMYVRGTARLRGGKADVQLPRHFALMAQREGITVQLTPNSADTYGLAAVRKSPQRIEVRELAGGRGDFDFDYVVFAARKDLAPLEVVRKRHHEPEAPTEQDVGQTPGRDSDPREERSEEPVSESGGSSP